MHENAVTVTKLPIFETRGYNTAEKKCGKKFKTPWQAAAK